MHLRLKLPEKPSLNSVCTQKKYEGFQYAASLTMRKRDNVSFLKSSIKESASRPFDNSPADLRSLNQLSSLKSPITLFLCSICITLSSLPPFTKTILPKYFKHLTEKNSGWLNLTLHPIQSSVMSIKAAHLSIWHLNCVLLSHYPSIKT